ncbi:hypothetical protein ACWCQL_22145 [Streptomyces sp. NPDC002073]
MAVSAGKRPSEHGCGIPLSGRRAPPQTNRGLLVLERRGGGTMVAFPGHPAKVGSDESAPRSEAIVGHGWNVYTFFF